MLFTTKDRKLFDILRKSVFQFYTPAVANNDAYSTNFKVEIWMGTDCWKFAQIFVVATNCYPLWLIGLQAVSKVWLSTKQLKLRCACVCVVGRASGGWLCCSPYIGGAVLAASLPKANSYAYASFWDTSPLWPTVGGGLQVELSKLQNILSWK